MKRPQLQIVISLLVALTTGTMLHLKRPPTTEAELRRDWFWAMKTHQTDEVDLVVYGDSRVSQAVDTRPLTEYFPEMTPRNLGYAGAGFNAEMYAHLRNISRGKEDRMIIVLGITPYGLSPEADPNEQFHEEMNRPAGEIAERLHLYPWLGMFEPIKPSAYRNAKRKHGMYITYHPGGWEEAYELPENPGKWLPGYRRHFKRTQAGAANMNATFEFVRSCTADGIRVFGFRPPSTIQMEQIEDESSGFHEATFIEEFEKAGGGWLQFEDRFSYYSYDGSHLHRSSAKRFSRHLAQALEDALK